MGLVIRKSSKAILHCQAKYKGGLRASPTLLGRLGSLRRHSSPDLLADQILCEQPLSPFSIQPSESNILSDQSDSLERSRGSKGETILWISRQICSCIAYSNAMIICINLARQDFLSPRQMTCTLLAYCRAKEYNLTEVTFYNTLPML